MVHVYFTANCLCILAVAIISSVYAQTEYERYVVMLKKDVTQKQAIAHIARVQALPSVSRMSTDGNKIDGAIKHYSLLHIYTLQANDNVISFIKQQQEVLMVEKDSEVTLTPFGTSKQPICWATDNPGCPDPPVENHTEAARVKMLRFSIFSEGLVIRPQVGRNLARISHTEISGSLTEQYIYNSHNLAIPTVYIFDSGVNVNHQEFRGRVSHGPVFARDPLRGPVDENGHGTRMMGIAIGRSVGVTPAARGVSIRVYNKDNVKGYSTDYIAAMEYVAQQPGENNMKVISISGGGYEESPLLSAAINALIDLGIHIVTAAGNTNSDTEGMFPCEIERVTCVGAVDEDDRKWANSNHGVHVDIVAPGTHIFSSTIGANDNTYNFSDGTSSAAAHVTGVIAYMLSLYGPLSPVEVREKLFEWAKVVPEGFESSPRARILNNGNGVW